MSRRRMANQQQRVKPTTSLVDRSNFGFVLPSSLDEAPDSTTDAIFVDLDAHVENKYNIPQPTLPLTIDETPSSTAKTLRSVEPLDVKPVAISEQVDSSHCLQGSDGIEQINLGSPPIITPLTNVPVLANNAALALLSNSAVGDNSFATFVFVIKTDSCGSDKVELISLNSANNGQRIDPTGVLNFNATVTSGARPIRPKVRTDSGEIVQRRLTFCRRRRKFVNLKTDDDDDDDDDNQQTLSVIDYELKKKIANDIVRKTISGKKRSRGAGVRQAEPDVDDDEEVEDGVSEANGTNVTNNIINWLNADGTVNVSLYPTDSNGPNGSFVCPFCDYANTKRYSTIRHMQSHSSVKPYSCTVCDSRFKTPSLLKQHNRFHTGEKPHVCPTCDAAFTTSGEVWRHVRYKHTFEKQHKCTVCDYASVEVSKLRRHMIIHEGVRPHKCDQCDYASPDLDRLRRHQRIHTNEQPYKCSQCDRRFNQSNSLKAHEKLHSTEYFPCSYCKTYFRQRHLFLQHLKVHKLLKQPKICNRCNLGFYYRHSFNVHYREHKLEDARQKSMLPDGGSNVVSKKRPPKAGTRSDALGISVSLQALNEFNNDRLKPKRTLRAKTDDSPPTVKKFYCECCSQAFSRRFLLKRHYAMNHPERPFVFKLICHLCQEIFTDFRSLRAHMKVHDRAAAIMKTVETVISRNDASIKPAQMATELVNPLPPEISTDLSVHALQPIMIERNV